MGRQQTYLWSQTFEAIINQQYFSALLSNAQTICSIPNVHTVTCETVAATPIIKFVLKNSVLSRKHVGSPAQGRAALR
ncbi:hypothetical protein [Acidovorax sp. Root568]|uniref:hypothetical protein n=1 Tax=Acidovorax sp. Root568 TaxID=1736565 RepID=UPI0012E3481E|nr:hypothetical protein [Acidovorax sp. Root568]